LKKELETKDSKILFLNREILLRNGAEEDKENGATSCNAIESAKKRYSSNVINSVLNNESLSKSIFKTGAKKRNLMELYENNIIPSENEPNGKRMKFI
jgi:hypothetical protein